MLKRFLTQKYFSIYENVISLQSEVKHVSLKTPSDVPIWPHQSCHLEFTFYDQDTHIFLLFLASNIEERRELQNCFCLSIWCLIANYSFDLIRNYSRWRKWYRWHGWHICHRMCRKCTRWKSARWNNYKSLIQMNK